MWRGERERDSDQVSCDDNQYHFTWRGEWRSSPTFFLLRTGKGANDMELPCYTAM
jgi:hypothetical protein